MTPFSKVKTWIKQGFYEKLPNSKSLKGALDFQQEVLDSLIREGLMGTVNCCDYYPVIPIIDVITAGNPTADEMINIPCNGLFISRADTVMYIWVKDCLVGVPIQLGNNL